MRRSLDDALLALRVQVKAWAAGSRPDIRVFVYPPECEAMMLARIPGWADDREQEGLAVDVVDIGQEFRAVGGRRRAEDALAKLELRAPAQLMVSLQNLARGDRRRDSSSTPKAGRGTPDRQHWVACHLRLLLRDYK